MKRFLIAIMGVFVLLGVNHASAWTSCHTFRRHVCLAQAPRHHAYHVPIWRLARLGPQSCFFDARRCRRGRGTWALLFLASRLLWFAPTVSVGHRDPVTRANVSSGIWLSSKFG
jgi:hypothetical protein